MALRELVNNVLRDKTVAYPHFMVEPDHVLNTADGDSQQPFVPLESYFEIRLSQMYLRDQREYWREFIPLTSVLAEFIFAGRREVVPVVVGPERLSRAQLVSRDDRVEYLNTRVAGPYPYEGDDLSLFVGLFRMTTNDWAVRALSLLETVAEAFDASKLTIYLNIAAPLVQGLEGLLGMRDVEMRLGLQKALTPPPVGATGRLPSGVLQPSFEVILRAPADKFDLATRQKFWVQEGRLFFGDSAAAAKPFDEVDFILYRLAPMAYRTDFTTFDFHRVHWPKVQEAVWTGNPAVAQQAFRLLAAALVESRDIVPIHRRKLLLKYKQEFDADLANYRMLFDPTYVSTTGQTTPTAAGPLQLSEQDLAGAVLAKAGRTWVGQPEEILAEVGV